MKNVILSEFIGTTMRDNLTVVLTEENNFYIISLCDDHGLAQPLHAFYESEKKCAIKTMVLLFEESNMKDHRCETSKEISALVTHLTHHIIRIAKYLKEKE